MSGVITPTVEPTKVSMNWNKVTITKDTRKDRTGYLVRWYGDYDPQKDKYSRYCRSFKTRKKADLFAAKMQADINEGEPKDPVDMTLKQLCDEVIRIKEKDLKFYKIIKEKEVYKKIISNEFDYVYILKFDGDIKKLRLQDEEVKSIKFIELNKLEKELKKDSKIYFPHGDYWFEMIDRIKSLN